MQFCEFAILKKTSIILYLLVNKDTFSVNARMAKLVNVAVSEAVGVQSLRVRVSLRAPLLRGTVYI
jgi:hypothetical protein